MKAKIMRFGLILTACIILISSFPLSAAAVSYSGKGTKSNPYLVETAEQLMGIEGNLSACYKLNNTIDLKGVKFDPIGNLAKPFTGIFTCDLDSDGTPKYAIKNVTLTGVKFDSLAKQNVAYKDDKTNEWEIGLFRSTSGATIENIAVIDATVTCGVIGESWQNADYTFNKGIGDQGIGILVGIAGNTKISGCVTTGKINTTGSGAGLLAGVVKNSTVQKSYSIGEVSSSGKWCIGSFIGTIETSTVKNCFSEGSVTQTSNLAPGKFASASKKATIENCYFIGTSNPDCDLIYGDETTTVKNCGTTAFDVGIKKITNFAKYVPSNNITTPTETVGDTSGSNQSSQTTDVSSGTTSDTSEETTVVSITAEEFMKKLNDAEVGQVNGWSFEDALEVIGFKDLYSTMSAEESAKVSDSYLSLMSSLYDAAKVLVVGGLTEKIDALPDAEGITADNAQEVLKVCEIYNSLPDDIKSIFNDKRVKKVQEAYEKALEMQDLKIINQKFDATTGFAETILIIVLIVINAVLISAAVILAILVFKNINRNKEEEETEE